MGDAATTDTLADYDDMDQDGDIVLEVSADGEAMEDGELEEPEDAPQLVSSRTVVRGSGDLPDLLQGIRGSESATVDKKTLEKLDQRAKKFNSENLGTELAKLYDSFDITEEERQKGNKGKFRLDAIVMFGVFALSEEDILEYFDDYSPTDTISLTEDACAVTFRSPLMCGQAMLRLSKMIGEPKPVERIVKHVISLTDEEPHRQIIERPTEESGEKYVRPSEIPLEIPEGKWRLGKHHKKCEAILLRFAERSDFAASHYLNRNRTTRNAFPARRIYEDSVVIEEDEEEEKESRKVDRRNPWGQVAEEWAGSMRKRPTEYPIDLDDLDRPPRILRTGLKDWDAPQDESRPIRLYPRPAAGSVKSRLGRPTGDTVRSVVAETFLVEEEEDEEADTSDSQMQWEKPLKKPRMSMVADLEEQRIRKVRSSVLDRLTVKGEKEKSGIIKRKIPNTSYVVKTDILEEDLAEDLEEEMEGGRSADLRLSLTNRLQEPALRPVLQASRRVTERFQTGRLAGRLGDGGSIERRVRHESADSLERDTGEDLGEQMDSIVIKVHRNSSSSDEEMDVDEEKRQREEERRRRKEKEERERQKRKEKERLEKEEAERKKQKEEEKRKDKEKRALEERKKELELLKEQEKKLLLEKEKKLRDLEKKREKEKREKEQELERKREKEKEKLRREKERERAKEAEREKERQRARARLSDKAGAKSRRRPSDSDSDSSSDSDNSSEESETESSSDESSSSDSDSYSSDSYSGSSSESEEEVRRKPLEKDRKDKKKSRDKRASQPVSSKGSSSKEVDEDTKKAAELRDKLKNYLKRAKEAKEEKKEKK